jgi:APA family basic amino acid/polyamine antiporter
LPHIRAANFTPLIPNGPWSVVAILPLLVGLYSGIESAAEAGEEIRNGRKVIARSLGIATLIGVVLYFGTSIVTLGVLGPGAVAKSSAPLYEAVVVFLGKWASPLLVFTALASIASAVNATYLIFARFLFAMGRDGVLSTALERIHPRWGTPYVAITVVYLLGLLSLLLPQSLTFLFLAANVPTMLKYFSNCLAAWRVAEYHRKLHAEAAFRLSRRAIKWWSVAGMACAVVIVLAGVDTDWRPYLVLLVWGALGGAYWLLRARHKSGFMRARLLDPHGR